MHDSLEQKPEISSGFGMWLLQMAFVTIRYLIDGIPDSITTICSLYKVVHISFVALLLDHQGHSS